MLPARFQRSLQGFPVKTSDLCELRDVQTPTIWSSSPPWELKRKMLMASAGLWPGHTGRRGRAKARHGRPRNSRGRMDLSAVVTRRRMVREPRRDRTKVRCDPPPRRRVGHESSSASMSTMAGVAAKVATWSPSSQRNSRGFPKPQVRSISDRRWIAARSPEGAIAQRTVGEH